jgi:hypothetical protein
MVEKYPATMHFWRNHKYDTEQLYFKILNFLLDTHFETQQGSSYKETLLTFIPPLVIEDPVISQVSEQLCK